MKRNKAIAWFRKQRDASQQEKLQEAKRVTQAVAKHFKWKLVAFGYLYEGATFYDPSGHGFESNTNGDRYNLHVDGPGLAALGRYVGALPKRFRPLWPKT